MDSEDPLGNASTRSSSFLDSLIRESGAKIDILDKIKPKYVDKQTRMRLGGDAVASSAQADSFEGSLKRDSQAILAVEDYLSPSERDLIKKNYLGLDREAKKTRRSSRRINFDWDLGDDTSKAAVNAVPPVQKSRSPSSPLPIILKTVDADGNEIEIMAPNRAAKEQGLPDDRHWSEKSLKEMQERDWRILREDFGISVSGGVAPPPLRYWQESPLPSVLLSIIDEIGYQEPTAIQRQTIPLTLAGKDVMGLAETGSGKTAAFILPMITRILRTGSASDETITEGPKGLILAPTRELALQIENEARKFCQPLGLRCYAIVGGHSMAEQSVHVRKGVDIIVATPGRLRDCLEQHVLALTQCVSLVLDEADRMIDLNFEGDLQFILSCLPEIPSDVREPGRGDLRQTTMFSATMPPPVEKLAKVYLRSPIIVTVGSAGQAAETVEQRLELLKQEAKDSRLLEILRSDGFDFPIIIFVNQKTSVEFLHRRLDTLGYRSVALHGGKSQESREAAISSLRARHRDILIATDVAGRGIDIPDVSLVINYDAPKSIEDYIHRIGRTGRMGQTGVAITFLTLEDHEIFYNLRIVAQKASKSAIPSEFLSHESSRTKPGTVKQRRRQEERIFAYGV